MDTELLTQNGWSIECESPLEIRNLDGSFASGSAAEAVILSLKLESILYGATDFQSWDDVLVMNQKEIKENFGITISNEWENFMKARLYRFYIGRMGQNEEGRAGFYSFMCNKSNPDGFFIEMRFIKELVNRSQKNKNREIARVVIPE